MRVLAAVDEAEDASTKAYVDSAIVAAVADTVLKALFDANTVLAATADNTPAALTVAEQTLVGRVTAGNVAALTATQVRTLLGLVIGTNVQAFDAQLAAVAGLTPAANQVIYWTSATAAAMTGFTAEARAEAAALAVPATVTGTTDTLAAGDRRRLTMYSNAGLVTVTVPTGVFAAGDWMLLQALGAAGLTLSTSGITINASAATNTSISTGEGLLIVFTASNTISVFGGTS